MAAQDIILRPVITEASMADMDDKKYVFDVAVNANKIQVRQAIEKLQKQNRKRPCLNPKNALLDVILMVRLLFVIVVVVISKSTV